jgi:CheY-like chemotaxis protein
MRSSRQILLVEADPACGRALALVLRRRGDQVRVARTRAEALLLVRKQDYDLAIVDLFVRGGGTELARELARRVPRLLLSFGARLEREEILEAALGFPVYRKAALAGLLNRETPSEPSPLVPEARAAKPERPVRARAASSNGRGSGGRRRESRPPSRDASAPAPEPDGPELDRSPRFD